MPVISASTEQHRPKGVIAVIAPWNFPFAIAMSDSTPALIAGNGVVLKPDNKTALCTLFGVGAAVRGRPAARSDAGRLRRRTRRRTEPDRELRLRHVHRLDRDRPHHRRAGRAQSDRLQPRAGRQEPDAGAGRRQPRRRDPGRGLRRLRQHRPGVHAYRADLRARQGVRRVRAPIRRPPQRNWAPTAGASYDTDPEIGSLVSVDHMERVAARMSRTRAQRAPPC